MKVWRYLMLWYMGGTAYFAIELLYRGWSHGSMFVTGGLCFLAIGHLGEMEKPMPMAAQMLLGGVIITTAELGCGLLVNRQYQVWNYSHLPYQFLGQICLPFTLLWVALSFGAILLYRGASRIFPSPSPYNWGRRDGQWHVNC